MQSVIRSAYLCLNLLLCFKLILSTSCTMQKDKWTWFLSNQFYYLLYDDETSLDTAQCLCNSLPGARLVIFDDDVSLSDVTEYLSRYYSEHQFWVDARRGLFANGDYTWGNNCTLPVDTHIWLDDEPFFGNDRVKLVFRGGEWKYCSVSNRFFRHYRPLCQSVKAPFNYLPTPPPLTWVRLGTPGHMFGFSNETRSLADARAACKHQEGKVYLATLDTLFKEVSRYILENHPDRTYWLDAVIDTTGGTPVFGWSTGGNITFEDPDVLRLYSSLVIYGQNNSTALTLSTGSSSFYYICEGNPIRKTNTTFTQPSLNWLKLGFPSKELSFSEDQKAFPEARETCAAQPGNVRLAVLDIAFDDVKKWILENHSDREYWVDASRPANSSAEFLWGDGQSMDSDVWSEFRPDTDDFVARLKNKNGTTVLSGTTAYNRPKNYICERVPEITLEWRTLGTPGNLFGFSRTQSLGFHWSREACSRQLGDVTLASLDTHFNDVGKFVARNYRSDQFWVDATVPTGGEMFLWGNGAPIRNTVWLSREPSFRDTVARIMTDTEGQTGLNGMSSGGISFYFICQGYPASPIGETEFSPPCQEELTTTEVAETTQASTETTMLTTEHTAVTMETTTVEERTYPPVVGRTLIVYTCNITEPPPVVNLSEEAVLNFTANIKRKLQVDTTSLSSSRRAKNSARDERPSAQAVGSIAIIILAVVLFLVVSSDLITFLQFVKKKVDKMKRKRQRRAKLSLRKAEK